MNLLRTSAKLILLIGLMTTTFSGCKKFENYNTIIELVVPDDCEVCDFYMYNWGDEDDLRLINTADFSGAYSFTPGKVVEVTIDWEYTQSVDPGRSIVLFLGEPSVNDDYGYEMNEGAGNWKSEPENIRPGKVYRWDPVKGTFEKTGEKTDKKGDGNNSGDDDSDNDGGGEPIESGWPTGTYKTNKRTSQNVTYHETMTIKSGNVVKVTYHQDYSKYPDGGNNYNWGTDGYCVVNKIHYTYNAKEISAKQYTLECTSQVEECDGTNQTDCTPDEELTIKDNTIVINDGVRDYVYYKQ